MPCIGCPFQTHWCDFSNDTSFAQPQWLLSPSCLFSLERYCGSCSKLLFLWILLILITVRAPVALVFSLDFFQRVLQLSLKYLEPVNYSKPPVFLWMLSYASRFDLWVFNLMCPSFLTPEIRLLFIPPSLEWHSLKSYLVLCVQTLLFSCLTLLSFNNVLFSNW